MTGSWNTIDTMLNGILNFSILFLLGISYLIIFSKFNTILTGKFLKNKNVAGFILYASILITSAIYLTETAELCAQANRFFMRNGEYFNAIMYSSVFFIACLLSAVLLTYSSFYVTSMITSVSEKEELANNNIELAIIHAIVLITLALITKKEFQYIISKFIPFPEIPGLN